MTKKIYYDIVNPFFAIFLRIQCIRTNEAFADLFNFPTIIFGTFSYLFLF